MERKCEKCGGRLTKGGFDRYKRQRYQCVDCKSYFVFDKEPITSSSRGITEAQLRAKHDVKFVINEKIKTLDEGVFLQTAEFVQLCQIKAGQGYRQVIDHPDYEAYRGRAGGVVYWSHPNSIRKLKNEGLLT